MSTTKATTAPTQPTNQPNTTAPQSANEPKESIMLGVVDSVSLIESMNLVAVEITTADGTTFSGTIGTSLWAKIKGDSWCEEGQLVRVVAETRIANKTTWKDDNGQLQFHTKDGNGISRISKGSQTQWKKVEREENARMELAEKKKKIESALKMVSTATDEGLSEEVAAQLIGQLMA